MELNELLRLTQDEVKNLSLIDQLTYYQYKYTEVCNTLEPLIKSSRAVTFTDIMEEKGILNKFGEDIHDQYLKQIKDNEKNSNEEMSGTTKEE